MLVVIFSFVYSIYITVMHKKTSGGDTMGQKSTKFNFISRAFIVLALVLLGSLGIYQSSSADTAQSASDYCGKYSAPEQKGACKEGLKSNPDCLSYSELYGEAAGGICNQSVTDLKSGAVSLTAVSTATPSSSTSTNTSNSETDKKKEAYKGAILLACSPYQDNEAAALWCLYGGLGKDGKEYKPQSDCFTKLETQGSVLNQTACQTGSEAGKTYLDSTEKNSDESKNSSGSILDLFGGLFGPTAKDKETSSDAGAEKNQQMSIQQLMSQMGGAIDMLHKLTPNAGTDANSTTSTSTEYYINGAGRKQKIVDLNPGHPQGAPAILFFNGGAWHANDQTGQAVMEGSPCKNYIKDDGTPGAPCSAAHQGGGLGDFGAPGGGGGVARGYAGYDVTYRLGSSGVYYMLEDVLRGVRHIIANADKYGIDPEKIIIWGDSAGGSLSMRAAASGISGAKVAVGWSAPTNAYTVLFASYKTFMLGLDHSTCIPTDLAGLANTTDLMLGGSGKIAEYGHGLASNDFSVLGMGGESTTTEDPMGTIGDLLTAAQYAGTAAMNAEAITQQLLAAYNDGKPTLEGVMNSGLTGGVFNMASKKLVECMDNLKTLSPALYASPNTPPSFLAGFDTDDVVPPQQLYDMRDKLRTLGIRSDALVLAGDNDADYQAFGASTNHLGYDPRMVCPTFNFIEEIMAPEKGQTDCGTGLPLSNYQDSNADGAAPEVPGFFQFLHGVAGFGG